LWAIIDLKSIPAMQYGQRMVRSVSVCNGSPTIREARRTQDSNTPNLSKSRRKQTIADSDTDIESTAAEISAGVPT
jgi:hypothetical protein